VLRRTSVCVIALALALVGLLPAAGCDDPTGVIPHGGIHFRDRNLKKAVRIQAVKQYGQELTVRDLRPLAHLRKLQTLDLSGNRISDVRPLSAMRSGPSPT
jgi:hypothetical protein